jgi:hypothetical protein
MDYKNDLQDWESDNEEKNTNNKKELAENNLTTSYLV